MLNVEIPTDDSVTPSRADLELIEQKYKSMAEFYSNRMVKYLQENYKLYYEYLNYGMGLDVIFPEDKAYTCPIYLGGAERMNPRYVNSYSTTPSPLIATYVATGGETNFTIVAMIGRTTYFASRGGLSKSITPSPTSDTQYLQITSGIVTLPTGDVASAGEVFTFLYQ